MKRAVKTKKQKLSDRAHRTALLGRVFQERDRNIRTGLTFVPKEKTKVTDTVKQ